MITTDTDCILIIFRDSSEEIRHFSEVQMPINFIQWKGSGNIYLVLLGKGMEFNLYAKKRRENACLKRENVKENQANRWNELRFCISIQNRFFFNFWTK